MHTSMTAKVNIPPFCLSGDVKVLQKREERIAELQGEIEELQTILGDEDDAEEIVSKHIKLLHRYNEAKDATQILIGKLAAQRETTIRQIHEDYGLTDDD